MGKKKRMVVEALGNRFHCWTTLRKREKSVLLYSRWCKKGKRTCVGKTKAQRRGRQSMKARSEMMFSALDIEELVSSSLAGSSGPGGVIIGPAFSYAAGLVTSFSPCTLSMLPLTIGYIASDDNHEKKISETESNSSDGSVNVFLRCASFSLGLSTTLTVAGSLSAVMGKGLTIGNAFGSSGPLLASTVAIVMGLNVLGVVQLFMPSFLANFDTMNIGSGQVSNRPDDSTNNNSCNCSSEHVRIDDWNRDSNGNLLPGWFRAYLTGMVFALAASPCSTSVGNHTCLCCISIRWCQHERWQYGWRCCFTRWCGIDGVFHGLCVSNDDSCYCHKYSHNENACVERKVWLDNDSQWCCISNWWCIWLMHKNIIIIFITCNLKCILILKK